MCDGFSFTLLKLRRKRSYLLGVGPNQSVRVGGGGAGGGFSFLAMNFTGTIQS